MKNHRQSFEHMLQGCWNALGGDSELLDLVDVTGDPDGLLPSNLAAMPAILATVVASTLAASVLDGSRTGRAVARVSIDCEHVALAARSETFARPHEAFGAPEAALFDPLSDFFETSDGWIRLHANYAWHRARALAVLGCAPDRQSVADTVRRWRGIELEDALAAAGALGFAVRTPRQWDEHPQGQAIAAQPLVTSRATSGRPRLFEPGRGAQGVKILDLTRVIAGPVATRTLAAWGGDVLRLDSPHHPELESAAADTLSGKRSADLDFGTADGQDQLDRLLSQADVLVLGYRPGSLDRFGLTESVLTQHYPHLICINLSAWGQEGPWQGRRGFDSLVQCAVGIASIEGDEKPGKLPAQLLDHGTGYLAAAAAMLALAEGQPRWVHVSLAQTAHWLTSAGTGAKLPARVVDPSPHLITLGGASRPMDVIAPPGATADLRPHWSLTTDLGADPPTFRNQ